MESSIAEFLVRYSACELLPTLTRFALLGFTAGLPLGHKIHLPSNAFKELKALQ